MVLRTISAARSHAARSAPGHAATWVGIAAMPSWASPKPAPGTVWRSGTISAAGSRSPGTLSFRHCRNSSAAADSQPDTHGCPRFCRYYRLKLSGLVVGVYFKVYFKIWSPVVLWLAIAWYFDISLVVALLVFIAVGMTGLGL